MTTQTKSDGPVDLWSDPLLVEAMRAEDMFYIKLTAGRVLVALQNGDLGVGGTVREALDNAKQADGGNLYTLGELAQCL